MAKVAKVKAVNYTAEQEARMREVYTGMDNEAEVAVLSKEFGKPPASVRAKLSQLKLYKSAKPAKGEGEDRVTKRVLAEAVGEKLDLAEGEVDGLEKAPKSVLEKLMARLA